MSFSYCSDNAGECVMPGRPKVNLQSDQLIYFIGKRLEI
jgi:hypothetical protein